MNCIEFAIEADELAQEADRQQVLALAFLLDDDLGQDRAGQVLPGLGVVHHEFVAGLHHLGEVVERHVGAGRGVVEAPVGVFLDDDRRLAVLVGGAGGGGGVAHAVGLQMLRNISRFAAQHGIYRIAKAGSDGFFRARGSAMMRRHEARARPGAPRPRRARQEVHGPMAGTNDRAGRRPGTGGEHRPVPEGDAARDAVLAGAR